MSLGKLYLIPSPLFEFESDQISESVKRTAINLKHYFVENIRTARRVLKSYDSGVDIDEITFQICNNKEELPIEIFKKTLSKGNDVGIMSEAGMPAFADPGSELVAIAHEIGAQVIPLSGPSSLLLALCGSGFNGQQFRFVGYLPIENKEKIIKLKELETEVLRKNETQIFIETPYRNNQLFKTIIDHLNPNIKLCVATNLTDTNHLLSTKKISDWKKTSIDLHKKPTIFLLGN